MTFAHARLDVWPYGFDWRPEDDLVAPMEAETPVRRHVPVRRVPDRPDDLARILHADDDPVARRIMHVLLDNPRIALTQVEDGDAAVSLLAMRPFDLVLLDLDMKRMTGEETLTWIRRSVTPWADLPVVALIEQRQQPRLRGLNAIGLTDWTPKPLVRAALTDRIIALLPGLHDAGL